MKLLLLWLHRCEQALCALGFAVMAAALAFDVGARILLGRGLVGAPQVGLVGMLVTAMFGIGLASHAGEHLRPRFMDGWCPPGWQPALRRIGDSLTGVFFFGLAALAGIVAFESYGLADVTPLLRWPVWLLQGVLVVAFASNGARHALFAWRPALAPEEAV